MMNFLVASEGLSHDLPSHRVLNYLDQRVVFDPIGGFFETLIDKLSDFGPVGWPTNDVSVVVVSIFDQKEVFVF